MANFARPSAKIWLQKVLLPKLMTLVSSTWNAIKQLFNYLSISQFADKFMYLAFQFGFYLIGRFTLLTATEMFVFKILYIYNYSRIARVNEYFLTNFVTSFNIIITFGFSMIRVCLEENLRTRFYYQNYAEPYEAYRKVYFP